jgi:hypothetical protein
MLSSSGVGNGVRGHGIVRRCGGRGGRGIGCAGLGGRGGVLEINLLYIELFFISHGKSVNLVTYIIIVGSQHSAN